MQQGVPNICFDYEAPAVRACVVIDMTHRCQRKEKSFHSCEEVVSEHPACNWVNYTFTSLAATVNGKLLA